MNGKDLSSNERWKKENSKTITFRVMNSTGIYEALKVMEDSSGKSRSSYILAAIKEALIRDGYLSENSEKSET